MNQFDLETRLMQFGTGNSLAESWRIKHSVLGCQAFGSNGSGKTSSMKTLALKYLRAGYGFLILSVKSERETWEEYCRLAGRSEDFIRIGEDSPHRFNFMRYLSQNSAGGKFTSNLLNILTTVIKTIDGHEGQNSGDPFWEKSLNLLLHNTISLCQLSSGHVSIQMMYDIIQSAPKGAEDGSENVDMGNPDSSFNKAFEGVRSSIAAQYQKWKDNWSDDEKIRFADREIQEKAFVKLVPKAREFRFVEQFFFETFKTLSFKTKSIILLSVSSFLFQLLQDPIYTLFCSDDEETTVTPESSLAGKVVLLDIPTKIYHTAGKSAQALYKYIFQLQSEKRDKKGDVRPCCIWADENAEWISSYDPIFQSTARDSLIAIVNICQNVNQYLSALGGKNSAEKVASFLATLNTKIWFSNGCPATNSMASLLIGDALFFDPSRTITTAEKFSQTDAVSLKVDRIVRENQFTNLLTGGDANGAIVEAYIHVQGDKLFNGKAYKKIRFNQNYK